MQTYYDILGVDPQASYAEIKKAYHKKAKECHSDSNPDDINADEKMKKVNEAYEILSDADKRAKYDYELKNGFNKTNQDTETIRKRTMDILKESLDNAIIGSKLKDIIADCKRSIHIYTFGKEFVNSFLFRFVFYFFPLYIIQEILPFTDTTIVNYIFIGIYIIVSLIDPYKLCDRVLNKLNVNVRIANLINETKEKFDKASEKYESNKEKYEDLYKLLPEKYAHIKVAKRLLYYLESGKAYCIEQAAMFYEYEVSEKQKRANRTAATVGAVGLTALVVTAFIFIRVAFFAMIGKDRRRY